MNKHNFIFFALAPTGEGISGSDRIFIELAREWSKREQVEIYTTREGLKMCSRQNLKGNYLKINLLEKRRLPSNFFFRYIYKIYLGVKIGLSLNTNSYLYSSSDFWMDVFPAVILKTKYPSVKWIATWYMTAPNPLKGFSERNRKEKYKISALLYWLSQLPVKLLIKRYADFVIVNNEDERKRFPEKDKNKRVFVLLGAVRLSEIQKYHSLHKIEFKVYDAVFQGRFHPQKGVVEMIEIWRRVVDRIPNAKLAMIGDGPLMNDVKLKIHKLGLENNIELFGYVFDGPEKYKIFSQSKIVVHPAFYDSGGMASAEAMAFGIPAVGFDLKAYESYYPRGFVKSKNCRDFSTDILELLGNAKKRKYLGRVAKEFVYEEYSWQKRAENLHSWLFDQK